MKALFWKEWRENILWAVLAALCVAGAMFYGLRSDPERSGYGIDSTWQGLLSPQLLLVSTFGFPLIGAGLGFLQILTELRRDQWAFLVHRPITRNTIFWGKALPGLLLYILATAVPYFVVAWWASRPGSLPAPFDWRMTEAGMMDLLTGSGFYFAALWTGIAPGRWFGPRLLPLVAACYGAVLSKGYQSFDGALEIALVTLLALIPASWNAFQTFGAFQRENPAARAATVLALLLATAMLSSWVQAGWALVFPRKPHAYTQYMVTNQGELVQVTQLSSSFSKVRTLDGRDVMPDGKRTFAWDDFLSANSVNLSLRQDRYPRPYRRIDRFFQQIHGNVQDVSWYFLQKNLQFVSYDKLSKRLTGHLGPKGFAPAGEAGQAGHFAMDSYRLRYQNFMGLFTTEEALYHPRFIRNEIQEVYRPPVGVPLLGGDRIYTRLMEWDKLGDFVSATPQVLQAHQADGTVLWTFPQPENLGQFSSVAVSRLADASRYFLLYQPDYNKLDRQPPLFFELSAEGSVRNRRELPTTPRQPRRLTAQTIKNACLTPFGQTLWQQVVYATRSALTDATYTPVWNLKPNVRRHTLTVWGISLSTGILCAAACLPLLRSSFFSPRERIAWSAFLILYGLAGVAVFFLVNRWPTRASCPSCGQMRSREFKRCPRCQAEWPAPARATLPDTGGSV